MSELNHHTERLGPASELGSVILSALQRQSENLGGDLSDPELWRIHGGTHNATVIAHSDSSGHSVICRRPLNDIVPDTGIYNEYATQQCIPPGVAPQSYCLDDYDPRRPIHVLERVEGRSLSYDEWSEEVFTSLASKLARAHIPAVGPPLDLKSYFMRPDLQDRIESIETRRVQELAKWVIGSTNQSIERGQALFDELPCTVLAHNDLQASNVIIDNNNEAWLWDWEFAGPLHPDLELGAFYYPVRGFRDFRAGFSQNQEQNFIEAYETVAGSVPRRLDRVRVGQLTDAARMTISMAALAEKHHHAFGMRPEDLIMERDSLLVIWEYINSDLMS